ncbi:hypothetical protein [Amycolatopsis panacis]|uniref:hypothetical protein n=1 Tax=Amycolatopsis panacis TaxID=2340917 RepID=UPI0011C36CAF|nr:hypothetical protein [Amycolatopsis panacis]
MRAFVLVLGVVVGLGALLVLALLLITAAPTAAVRGIGTSGVAILLANTLHQRRAGSGRK